MLGKKSSEKSAKIVFLYSHEYRDQKMGEKKRETIFPGKTLIVRAKMLGKKSSERSEKNIYFYSSNIVTKKWGEKRAKQF